MRLITNTYFEPNKVVHVFGTRTLVLANNTKQEGMFFHNVHVTVQRKGYTSSLSINKEKEEKINVTFGLFFGGEVEPVSGVKFEGKTNRDGREYKFYLCKIGAIIKEYGITYVLTEEDWVTEGHYEMQVVMKTLGGSTEWRSIRASGTTIPYEFATSEEAQHMLDICYPSISEEEKRIKFVAE